jgi:anthranilate synthase component 2
MLVIIDNYDSFVYNLVHFLGELGAQSRVFRNDAISVDDVLGLSPDAVILSPGPCNPDRAGICLDLVNAAAGSLPILGVCLGHQTIGQAFGGDVVRAPTIMHGKRSRILHQEQSVFAGLEDGFWATRYHSLTIEPDSVPDVLEVTAQTEDGVIMGLAHKEHPIHGVQFHPESIASELGHAVLANFLTLAGITSKELQKA